MKTIHLMIGVPAAGKTWVTTQLAQKFHLVHHDAFIGHASQPQVYVSAILEAARTSEKPILAEAPFSVSQIKEPLEKAGHRVVPVFIFAPERELQSRWDKRGNVSDASRKGHLTRQKTYAERAREWRAFSGTSDEVFRHLSHV